MYYVAFADDCSVIFVVEVMARDPNEAQEHVYEAYGRYVDTYVFNTLPLTGEHDILTLEELETYYADE